MIEYKCGKCKGSLKETGETIETVDYLSDYEIKKVEVLICESCKTRYHITSEGESND